ncbi:AcrR family transcriptional regulator [Nocardioides luteus]|uniref:TetR family transcriptional regulator n=1 Tax=Nocardioides luteus TaxID=1844 RepID=A0ABQ5T226_9ACTN|nr:TetR/AcrR family transcriptional regulator [Nocardioides luteus]MDR7310218.1 AcrR family transcriptional regulator [Nocardioides luteus]GGR69634.1 TetR family transcriptional regulator [Nocardioides luteus]GLJ70314.1 TetR family transcriptional regulator [Nocardioides luteus]
MPKISEEHRAEKRQQIIAATLRCVERDGFHKTTMAAVVKESGLSAGSVYTYFRGKSDIIRAIAESGLTAVAEAITSFTPDPDSGDAAPPPERAIEAATQHLLDLSEELGVDLPRIALQTWAEAARDPEVRDLMAPEARRIRAAWRTYAEGAVAAGRFHPDADPERIAIVLTGLLPGFILQRIIVGDVSPKIYGAGLSDLLAAPSQRATQ